MMPFRYNEDILCSDGLRSPSLFCASHQYRFTWTELQAIQGAVIDRAYSRARCFRNCTRSMTARFSSSPLHVLQELNQLPGYRCQQLLAAVNDSDWTDQLGHVQRHGGNHAIFNLAAHAGFGQDADAGLNGDRLLDGFDVVELHGHFRFDSTLPQRTIDRLANGQVFFKCYKLLVCKVPRRNDFLSRQRVRSVTHEHHAFVVPWNHLQRTMGAGKGQYSDIRLVTHNSLNDLVGV